MFDKATREERCKGGIETQEEKITVAVISEQCHQITIPSFKKWEKDTYDCCSIIIIFVKEKLKVHITINYSKTSVNLGNMPTLFLYNIWDCNISSLNLKLLQV